MSRLRPNTPRQVFSSGTSRFPKYFLLGGTGDLLCDLLLPPLLLGEYDLDRDLECLRLYLGDLDLDRDGERDNLALPREDMPDFSSLV